jgi:hypothetical protein
METRSRDVPRDTGRWDLPPDRKPIRKFLFAPKYSYVGAVTISAFLLTLFAGLYLTALAILVVGTLIDLVGYHSLGWPREP